MQRCKRRVGSWAAPGSDVEWAIGLLQAAMHISMLQVSDVRVK
jgi:hypothetical protein